MSDGMCAVRKFDKEKSMCLSDENDLEETHVSSVKMGGLICSWTRLSCPSRCIDAVNDIVVIRHVSIQSANSSRYSNDMGLSLNRNNHPMECRDDVFERQK